MKTFLNLILEWIVFFLLVSLSGHYSYGQESWSFRNKYITYTTLPSEVLKVTMISGKSLTSEKFVNNVSGVSFLGIAQPDPSIKNQPIIIDYNSQNKDGYRLKIIIGKDTLTPNIPDWQLIPIINYSNSEYNACVSLFGPKSDSVNWNIIYHPAFKNTLLGLRLLHADMVFMDLEIFSRLPQFKNQTIIGEGESLDDTLHWKKAAMQVQSHLYESIYQSWVLTDDNIQVVFSKDEKKLIFSGEPYFFFWILNYNNYTIKRKALETKYQSIVENHNKHVESFNLNNNDFDKEMIEKLKIEIDSAKKELDEFEYEVIPVSDVMDKLKSQYSLISQINSPVFNATLNVMQFSSFFRYLKQYNSVNWNNFFNKTNSIQISPQIKTPCSFPKPQ